MISYAISIDHNKCNGCGECVDMCPLEIYVMKNGIPEPQYMEECIACESCLEACEFGAISLQMHVAE